MVRLCLEWDVDEAVNSARATTAALALPDPFFEARSFLAITTADRVIGFKRGTGGTQRVSWLLKRLDVTLFPEICKLRTDL
jgi:tryptophan 2,3-dioxygenase